MSSTLSGATTTTATSTSTSTTTTTTTTTSTANNTQTEKPDHYAYLKEFRVEQCKLFREHQCPSHKPFTCFNWHFLNQRRRRPLRKRDGTFNYSPDDYCKKYDEATGICPDGDNCQLLHKTAGDTEKHYHLRHYKTCMCMYDTDSKGFCKKNGPHCAYAHGAQDLRAPVLDIREIQALENQDDQNVGANGTSGPNNLDRERNLGEDPKWQDTNYVLAAYKTEPCKKPPRLCRQGYTCPQYHNSRDRRRSPQKFKYRTTPCPHVKHLDEWCEPNNCESGDSCQYCHTRTEQQFHPEIYKSTKCNDMQQMGHCPRGVFCAFAHVDQEITTQRDILAASDGSTCLATFMPNTMPQQTTTNNSGSSSQSNSRCSSSNGNGSNNQASSASNGILRQICIGNSSFLSNQIGMNMSESHLTYQKAPGSEREDKEASIRKQMFAMGTLSSTPPSIQSTMVPMTDSFYQPNETVESVVGSALEDLSMDDISVNSKSSKDIDCESNHVNNSISVGLAESGLLTGSAPVSIPGNPMNSNQNPLHSLTPPTSSSPLSSTPPVYLHASHMGQPRPENSLDQAMASAFMKQPNAITSNKYGSYPSSNFYDFTSASGASSTGLVSSRPCQSPPALSNSNSMSSTDVQQLWEELCASQNQFVMCKERIDHEVAKVKTLKKRFVDHLNVCPYTGNPIANTFPSDFMDPVTYSGEYSRLRQPMHCEVETNDNKNMGHHASSNCMSCNDKPCTATLLPCAHSCVCTDCATRTKACPFCGIQVIRWSGFNVAL